MIEYSNILIFITLYISAILALSRLFALPCKRVVSPDNVCARLFQDAKGLTRVGCLAYKIVALYASSVAKYERGDEDGEERNHQEFREMIQAAQISLRDVK